MKAHMLVLEATLAYGAVVVATPALAKSAKHDSPAPQIICNMYSCHPVQKQPSSSKKSAKTHSGATGQGQQQHQPPHHL